MEERMDVSNRKKRRDFSLVNSSSSEWLRISRLCTTLPALSTHWLCLVGAFPHNFSVVQGVNRS
jgi:hypothetical protein